MLLQKLVFPLCEDDRVLHDMDRSGEKQSQAPGRSCPYLTNLLQRSDEDLRVCRRSCSPCTGPRSSGCLALCLSMGCTVAWCTSSLLCITRWSMRCSMRQGSKIRPRGFLGRGVSFQRKGDAPAPTSRGRGGRRRSRDAPAPGSSNSSPTIYVLHSCPLQLMYST